MEREREREKEKEREKEREGARERGREGERESTICATNEASESLGSCAVTLKKCTLVFWQPSLPRQKSNRLSIVSCRGKMPLSSALLEYLALALCYICYTHI